LSSLPRRHAATIGRTGNRRQGNGIPQIKRDKYRSKLKLAEVREKELVVEAGESIPYDLLFCVPPHKAPKPVIDAGLADPATGWIPVNLETLETKHHGVYAVGDVTSVPTPKGYVPYLPKAGVFAHGQAEVVANNIATEIKGKGKKRSWDGHGSCFLEVGQGKKRVCQGQFLGRAKASNRVPFA
jgi:sulfide:quinone oxidoreductase